MAEQTNNLQLLDSSGTLRGIDPTQDSLKITVPFAVSNDMSVGGDLTVNGDIIARSTQNAVIQDAVLDLGLGNATGTAQAGGFTVQVNKASGFTPLTVTAFQSKATSGGDANFTVASDATLSVGDVVAIMGAKDGENDGYYVVKAKASGVVSVEPDAMNGLPFAQTNVKTSTEPDPSPCKAYKVDLGVVLVADGTLTKSAGVYWPAGTLVTAYAAPATKVAFQADGAYQGASDVTLDEAYVFGRTITTSAAKGGDVVIAGDQKLDVTASGGVSITHALSVGGNATVTGTLGVTGEATLASATVSDLTSGRVVLAGASGSLRDDEDLTYNVDTNLLTVPNLSVGTAGTIASLKVSDLTSGRVVLAGTSGEIEDSGNLTFSGSLLDITGAVQTSGNATFGGNLSVTGTSAMTGAVTMSSTLGVTGAITGTSATLSSTLGVTGESTLASATVSDITATHIVFAGTAGSLEGSADLKYDGTDFKVGASFSVAKASGNTTIGGTLSGTGAATLSSTLGVAGNFAVNTDKFTVAASTGNTSIAGTLGVTGTFGVTGESTLASATVSDLTDNRIVLAGTAGALEDSADLTFDGTDFKIGVDKFQVTKSNGNTSIAGTLGVTGAATLSGTLGVTGEATLASATVSDLTNTRIVLAGVNGALQDDSNLTFNGTTLVVGSNKFTVAQSTGNTLVDGTLTVNGDASFAATGGSSGSPDFSVAGYAKLTGVVDLDGSVDADVTTFDVLGSDKVSLVSSKVATDAVVLQANAGGVQVQGAGSSHYKVVAHAGGNQKLELSATNTGAGQALIDIVADETITVKSDQASVVIARANGNGAVLDVQHNAQSKFQVNNVEVHNLVTARFEQSAGTKLTANASANVAQGTICAFDSTGKMISANSAAGGNTPSSQDEVTRYPFAAAVITVNSNTNATFQTIPGTVVGLTFDVGPTSGLVGQAVYLGAAANAGKATLTAPTDSNASIWRVGILASNVADPNGKFAVYWHPQYLGRRPVIPS